MEYENQDKPTAPNVCVNCGNFTIQEGSPTPLCSECRKKFINYPIPVPIKLFAAVIGLLLVFAMSKAPANFTSGIHYERGKEAVTKKKYHTARMELQKVISKVPGFSAAKEYLAVACFYDLDLETFVNTIKDLEGKNIEVKDLYGELSQLIIKATSYWPSDSFMTIFGKYHSFDSIPQSEYHQYVLLYPDELFPLVRYSSALFDNKMWKSSDSLLDVVLEKDPAYINALYLKTSIKREKGEFDSAHYYCDRILSLNIESTYGMASKARTFLRQKNDEQGLQWAIKSIANEPDDAYSKATLALAYHFSDKHRERDKILEAAKKDSLQFFYMQYVYDVMEGKEKFR